MIIIIVSKKYFTISAILLVKSIINEIKLDLVRIELNWTEVN